MNKSRMEAFSDGVIAILTTIMVFEIKAPEGADIAALMTVVPSLLTFLLSFLYLGIYWNNLHWAPGHRKTVPQSLNVCGSKRTRSHESSEVINHLVAGLQAMCEMSIADFPSLGSNLLSLKEQFTHVVAMSTDLTPPCTTPDRRGARPA